MEVNDSFEIKLAQLNKTMDIYLKRRFENGSVVLKSEMQKVKEVIKEKLGVDIDSKS